MMLTEETGPAKLLVKAALEALLAKSASRLDAEARNGRLMAAALMECAENGYAGLTMTNIARRAKVSTSTIYAEYPDRDKLLVAAMEMLFALLATDVIEVPPADDPQRRVEQLLIAHGQVYAEPLTMWITRLYVVLTWAGHDHLRQLGLQAFRGIDTFWVKFLGDLESEGHLAGIDPELVVPWLLGPVERCTLISRLGCGEDDPSRPSLSAVARHGAERLFQLFGRGAQQPAPKGNPQQAAALLKALIPVSEVPLSTDREQTEKPARTTPQLQKASILKAARMVCSERGFELASIRDISVRAGVSTATIYSHYADKADLFSSALENDFALHSRYPENTGQTSLDAALFLIASRAADPNWVWMHSIRMASTLSETPRVVAIGHQHRDLNEAYLAGALDDAVDGVTLNFLLGPVERSGKLALILFGKTAVDLSFLARLATFTALSFERTRSP
jgi:AcrR family transcriptional regulator